MSKQSMSEQERLELAAKLDQQLDDFIESLPRRPKPETIPFDRWEEEIANHPFFMKDVPEPGDTLHPLYEGLQKLKYDPDENEPEELALAYKDDGNFNFKHKKYRMAIISYTEGIKAKSGNPELDATLYNNRSASHFFLENYRSALLDAEAALKLKPDYDKALIRAANCCYKTGKFEKAVEFSDRILESGRDHKEALELRQKSLNGAKKKDRDNRKRETQLKKVKQEEEEIIREIQQRTIKIEGGSDNLSLSKLEPQFPQLVNCRVSLLDGRLVWPVVFFYPEYKIMDYIQRFDETTTFLEQLTHVFEDYPEWDKERNYQPDNLSVYFEDDKKTNRRIDVNKTLLEILKLDGHVIRNGTPKFVVLVGDSECERLFMGLS